MPAWPPCSANASASAAWVSGKRAARIRLEVALPLQPRRRLRLHAIHRHADVAAVVHGVDDGHRVDAPLGVQRAQDPVVVRRQPGARLVLAEPHSVIVTLPP